MTSVPEVGGHAVLYVAGNELVCTCGVLLSNYGLTRSTASLFAQHVREANTHAGAPDELAEAAVAVRVAEVLRQHAIITPRGYAHECCTCGWESDLSLRPEDQAEQHLAAVIAAALAEQPNG